MAMRGFAVRDDANCLEFIYKKDTSKLAAQNYSYPKHF